MAPQERVRSRRNNRLFLFGLVLITLARLYLVRNEDIVSVYSSGYDDLLYAQLGEHLFWGRPPDEKSLVPGQVETLEVKVPEGRHKIELKPRGSASAAFRIEMPTADLVKGGGEKK